MPEKPPPDPGPERRPGVDGPRPEPAPPPKKKKSWLVRILLTFGIVAVALVLLLLFVAPPVAASIAAGKIKESFGKTLNGDLDIGSLSLSLLGGTAELTDLKITPRGAEPLFTLPKATATVGVFSAIGGRYDVKLEAQDALVNIVRETDGRTNLDALLQRSQEPPPAPKEETPSASEPLNLKVTVRVTGTRLVLRDKRNGKESEIRNFDLNIDLPSMDSPADIAAGFDVLNGGKADFKAQVNPTTLEGTVSYLFDVAALKSLEAAAGIFAPIVRLEGKLAAKGDYTFTKFPAIKGEQTLTLDGLTLAGPLVGAEPVTIPSARVTQTVTLDDQGNGTAVVRLESGAAADLRIDARLKGVNAAATSVDGKLAFSSDLKELTSQIAGLLKLKEGYRLQGRLTSDGNFNVAMENNVPTTAKVDLNARGAGLVVVDSSGQATPLDTELVLATQADYSQSAGTLAVPALKFEFGDLKIDGRASVSGLKPGQTLAIQDSSIDARADLDKVSRKLASFMDLKDKKFEGSLNLTASVTGRDKLNQVVLAGDLKQVKIGGLTRTNEQGQAEAVTVGPISGKLNGKLSLNMADGGVSKIEELAVLSNLASISAGGTIADLAKPEAMKMDLTATVRAMPEEIYRTAGAFLGPRGLAGKPVDLTFKAAGTTSDLEAKINAQIPELTLTRKDSPPMTLKGLTLSTAFRRKNEFLSWALIGTGIDGNGKGKLWTEPSLKLQMSYSLTIKTPEAGRLVLPLLGDTWKDVEVDGDPLKIEGEIDYASSTKLKGMISGKRIVAKGGALPAPLKQENIDVRFNVAGEGDRLAIDELKFSTATGSGQVQGRIAGSQDMNFTMSFTSDLARVAADLGGLLNLPQGAVLKGALTSSGEVKTVGGVTRVSDRTVVRDFHMSGPNLGTVNDAEVKMDALASIDFAGKTIDFTQGAIQSSFLRGTLKGRVLGDGTSDMELRGMEVDFAYVPEKLNTVLAPWLGSTKLLGQEERKIVGRLEGKAAGGDWLALLRGSTGSFDASLGQILNNGYKFDGRLDTKIEGGMIKANGPMAVNGGKSQLTGDFSLADAKSNPVSQFTLKTSEVGLNPENGNLLGLINPIFQNAAKIDGKMATNLEGNFRAPLNDSEAIKKSLRMTGSVGIDNLAIAGSGFMNQILQWMEVEETSVSGYVRLPDLKVENGLISYQQMEMRISHTVLRFRGTIDFDKNLNLIMKAPLDKKMLKGIGFDKDTRELIGKYVDIPITGTASNPKFDFGAPIRAVADAYIKSQIEKGIQKGIEDLLKPKKKK